MREFMPYYYLGGLITPIDLDKRAEISWREFYEALQQNLSLQDLEQMHVVLRYFDLENLRLYLQGQPVRGHGRLLERDFAALFIDEPLEPWWENFLEKQGHKDKSATLVNELQYSYFQSVTQGSTASARVLSKLWKSHWMSAYVRLGIKNQEAELALEPGAKDDKTKLWMQEFQQGLGSYELEELKRIWQPSGLSLEEIAKNYIRWQIDFFSEEMERPFELEALLSYLIQLAWIERWQEKNPSLAFDLQASSTKALSRVSAEMAIQATEKKG
jgi:hypothetical protein